LGFAAVNTGNNLLFIIVATLLAFMAVTGIVGWLNIRGLALEVRVPDEVYCGLPTLVVAEIVNAKPLIPSFLLRVKMGEGKIIFPMVASRGRETLSLLYTFPERGRYRFNHLTVSSPFPVNFFVRSSPVKSDEQYLVFPAPLAGPSMALGSGRDRRGEPMAGGVGHDGDIEKIGNYTGREPFKRIHWRLSARHDGLKVKELGVTGQEPLVIDIANQPGRGVEERLSTTVHTINRLMRSGHPVGLKLGEKLLLPATSRSHRLDMLRELALYDRD
jgi:uncharacterized protein (DUF58 family)